MCPSQRALSSLLRSPTGSASHIWTTAEQFGSRAAATSVGLQPGKRCKECFKALRSLLSYHRFLAKNRAAVNSELRFDVDIGSVKSMLRSGAPTLTERQSKQVLAHYGIPVTAEFLAPNADEAVSVANRLGYPVVLKIESPEIAHKTEARGVEIGVSSDEAVRAAYERIIANAKAYNPTAQLNGVLVQEMIRGGREMIIGMTQDPQWGPMIVVGLGGIFVEVLKDISARIAPLGRDDVEEMLRELKSAKIFQSFRGQAAADVDAIIDIVMRFAQLCIDLKEEIQEIDINPLLVFDQGKGVKVADCLMTRRMAAK